MTTLPTEIRNLQLPCFNLVEDDSTFLVREFYEDVVVLTSDGVFINPILSGTSCIINDKVYRFNQFKILGNWFNYIHFYRNNRNFLKSVCVKFYFSLDDHDCCADGIIGGVNPNGTQFSIMVPFSSYVHEKISESLNY